MITVFLSTQRELSQLQANGVKVVAILFPHMLPSLRHGTPHIPCGVGYVQVFQLDDVGVLHVREDFIERPQEDVGITLKQEVVIFVGFEQIGEDLFPHYFVGYDEFRVTHVSAPDRHHAEVVEQNAEESIASQRSLLLQTQNNQQKTTVI